jgi:hypothetical protein
VFFQIVVLLNLPSVGFTHRVPYTRNLAVIRGGFRHGTNPKPDLATGRLPHDRAEGKGGNHSFRATGITAYLKNGGRLEVAQQMANHENSRTTGFYDRRGDQITLDEVEGWGFEPTPKDPVAVMRACQQAPTKAGTVYG